MTAPEAFARVSHSAIGRVHGRDLCVRFFFGALAGAASGAIGLAGGAELGGVFLALPATLLATLTLIEKRDSRIDAERDDDGAAMGAVALVAFALVAWQLFGAVPAPVVLVAATAVWCVAAVGLYAVMRRVRPPS